jgi:deoxyribonuclease-4
VPKVKATHASRSSKSAGAPHRTQNAGLHRLGAHTSIAGGMHHALEIGLRLGCDAVQVFVKNQRRWRAAPLRPDDLQHWFALLETPGFGPVIAHGTYLINLASPDQTVRTRSRAAFRQELQRCQVLRIPYLVFHPGAATDGKREPAIARVAAALDEVAQRRIAPHVTPLLENTAGQGAALGWRLEELGDIIGRLHQPAPVGVCLDTCHLFAAGYDIRNPKDYQAMIATADRAFGRRRIRCWHLNDSRAALGSRVDRHEHIGRGQIGTAGFRNLLADARFRGLPMIIETPKGRDPADRDWDTLNLRRLRRLAAHCLWKAAARGRS